jgi:hypothetical protein
MSPFARLLDRLFPAATDARVSARFAVYRHHLSEGGDPYMLRYILQTPWGTLRLHNIRRSDRDRHLHDHPWDFTSFLLTGGYTEELPGSRRVRISLAHGGVAWKDEPNRRVWPWLSVVRHAASDLHKLHLTAPVWTLVWTGPRIRDWGFQTEDGWVCWRTYLGIPMAERVARGKP